MIAGLRATNEMMLRNNEIIEEKKDLASDLTKTETKDAEKIPKKAQQPTLSRSDSTGSGRKFLAPTLSDPQSRCKPDRFNDSKKKSIRQAPNKSQLPHLTESGYHPHHHHHLHVEQQQQNLVNQHVNLTFEVHDWWSEQMIFQDSSDEEA